MRAEGRHRGPCKPTGGQHAASVARGRWVHGSGNRFGGVAYGQVKGTVAGIGSVSNTNVGWAAGGGLECAFANNWSVKFEYLYVDLGKDFCNAARSGGNPFDVEFRSHLIRGGLSFRF
jgi:opacity protein-like surface antigen